MSTPVPEAQAPGWRFALLAFGLCLLPGLGIAAATEALHFWGDDWEFILPHFDRPALESLIAIVMRQYRLGQELYQFLMISLFDLDRLAFLWASMALHALACALFAVAVLWAFPGRRAMALGAAAVALLYPSATATTFITFLDVSRIGMATTFGAFVLFQWWAGKPESWGRLALACFVFTGGLTVYENGALFILTLPAFLIHPLTGGYDLRAAFGRRDALVRLFIGLAVSFVAIMAWRYGAGFADKGLAGSLDPAGLPDFFVMAGRVMVEGARELPGDAVSWGLAVACVASFAWAGRHREAEGRDGMVLAPAAGAVLFVLAPLPYWLAGYTPQLAWDETSRFLSGGGFGLGLVLAAVSSRGWLGRGALAALALVWLAHWAGLRGDWAEAAGRSCRIFESLVAEVPAVDGNAVLLFEDLRHRHDGIPVFAGSDALLAIGQLLYKETPEQNRLGAVHILERVPGRIAPYAITVTERGVETWLSQYFWKAPSPFESTLILKREDDRVTLVEGLEAPTPYLDIDWQGGARLASNRAKIVPYRSMSSDRRSRLLEGLGCG